MTVFADPLGRIFPDEEHSVDELREIIIGHSTGHQLIFGELYKYRRSGTNQCTQSDSQGAQRL